MEHSTAKSAEPHLLRARRLLYFGGTLYLLWWAIVEAVLPGSFNPLLSRLAVVASFFAFFAASFFSDWIARNLLFCFYACAWLATLHYFYLFHFNGNDVNWVVGSYITIMALCACLESLEALTWFGCFVTVCSLILTYFNPSLGNTVFLPGMITILAFAYVGSHRRLKLMTAINRQALMLEDLFNSVFEGVVVSHQGTIVNANRSFLALLGYEKSEVLQRSIVDFVIPEEREHVQEQLNKEQERSYETVCLRKDGSTLPVEVLGRHHFWENKKLRITAIRDLTDAKKSERNRIMLEASTEALKLSDEFIMIASHELKTPLTTIQLQTDIARHRIASQDGSLLSFDAVADLLTHLERQTKQMIRAVEDMLYSSYLTLGTYRIVPELFQLSDLMKSSVDSFQADFEQAKIPVTLELDSDVPIRADPRRIEQVLLNLFSNAVKYGAGGPVRVSLRKNGDRVVICVQDRGIGIAPEDQQRIFGRFERAVSARKISGMGLGLFICKRLVEAHHGTIEVSSHLGEGTQFTVTLPLSMS